MLTVRIQHRTHDFDALKPAFDSDPIHRYEPGVRRDRITRPVSDPRFIEIDLDFDTAEEADAFLAAMRTVWQWPQATAARGGSPQSEVVELVEHEEYA
jgi:hypothetical protein